MYFRAISTVLLGIVVLATAQIPLTFDLSKEQIFVQGNWYNKDGSNGKQVVTPHAFFAQCMHHENASGCDTTWSQRYWVNTNYYQPGRPIFIELAGEWDAAGDVDGGYWHVYAQRYNAMLIVLEHRFYGQSFPVQNPAVRDLWLMTSQLALADAAKFITDFTANNNLNGTSWVSFGCSYGGNLAAWFKLKYPNHVKAAVSSSGPVEALYDYPGYMKTVSEVVQAIDDVCYDQLYDTFGCMEALVNGSANSCEMYETPDDLLAPLKWCHSVDWDGISKEQMFNSLGMSEWADNAPSGVVRTACNMLAQINGDDNVEIYGNFMEAMGHDGGCLSMKKRTEEREKFLMSQEAWQSGAAGWDWQTCNEFGYFMSSDPTYGTYGRNTWSGDVFGEYCGRFGPQFTRDYVEERIATTNEYYGGKDLDSRCVIFVHGTWDPWHTQGVTTSKTDNTVIVVPQTEHCADIGNPTTPEMATAQAQIMAQIGTYLIDPMC